MQVFDPFTATLAEAKLQPDPYALRGAIHRWSAAQMIIEKRAYFERHPIEGVSSCVRHGLVAPDWLAELFIQQDDKLLRCEVGTRDEAFGAAHEAGKHLATHRLRRDYRDRVEALFKPESEAYAYAFAPSRIDALLEDATVPGVKLPEEPPPSLNSLSTFARGMASLSLRVRITTSSPLRPRSTSTRGAPMYWTMFLPAKYEIASRQRRPRISNHLLCCRARGRGTIRQQRFFATRTKHRGGALALPRSKCARCYLQLGRTRLAIDHTKSPYRKARLATTRSI